MAYKTSNPNGQATMANSEPVVIASDQSAVPVSGTVTANIGTVATLATAAKQDTGNTSVASIDTKTPALGQALAAASVPVVLTAAQITTLTPPAAITGFALDATLTTTNTEIGATNETAPATDTATSGLNGRLQRIAQRITSLITALGSPFQAGGSIGNTSFAATQATAASLNATVVGTGTFAVQEATLDAALIAQEATTSGVKGVTAFGAVTTAAPTYITAKSDALSLTTGGALRSDITTIKGTAPTTAGFIDVKGADGDVFVRQTTGTNLHTVLDSGTLTTLTTLTGTTTLTPGTAATNLGKAEDAGHSSGDTGVMALAVRNDTAAALAGTTLDYIPLTTNARGATWIAIEDGAGGQVTTFGGGTQYADEAAFTAATNIGTATMLAVDDTTPDYTAENVVGIPRMSKRREQYMQIRDANGAEVGAGVDDFNQLQVDSPDIRHTLEQILIELQDARDRDLNRDARALETLSYPSPDPRQAPLSTTSIAYELSRVVKTSPGVLFSFTGYNSKTSAQWVQVFDDKKVPSSGAIPVITLTVPPNSNFSYSAESWGRAFTRGIVVVNSTTGPTYTAGSADCFWDIQYM